MPDWKNITSNIKQKLADPKGFAVKRSMKKNSALSVAIKKRKNGSSIRTSGGRPQSQAERIYQRDKENE